MSQRLTNAATLTKPRIVGWMRGCPIWSLQGAAPPDDDTDDTASGGGKDDTSSEGKGADDDDPDDKKEDDKPPAGDTVTKEEYDRLYARMQAADRNATEAAKKVREYEDKDKTELERATARAEEAEAKLAEATVAVQNQAIRLAFLSASSDVTWHDPEDALAFAMKSDDLKDLKVNEDGSVDKSVVVKAVKDLAKSKPYLVKKASETDDDDKDDKDKNGSSGHQPNGGKDKTKLDREKLAAKYPALRR